MPAPSIPKPSDLPADRAQQREQARQARAALVARLRDSLPDAMRQRAQWLLWRFIDKPGGKKPAKVPFYANGHARGWPKGRPRDGVPTDNQPQVEQGHPLDRAALVSLDDALKRMQTGQQWAGIGFAFLPDDDLVGIDVDHAIDRTTGAPSEMCSKVVELCASYAELSPSGTGLHIICHGKSDKFKDDALGLEVYAGSQYFTCTGQRWPGTPAQVQTVDPLVLDYLRELVAESKAQQAAALALPGLPAASAGDNQPSPQATTGTTASTTRKTKAAPTASAALPPADDFKRVNDAAMGNLPGWVPALFPEAKASTGGYRVSSKALGRDLQEDLSIKPKGIVDFGVNDLGDARQGKRTPIDLVLEHGHRVGVAKPAEALRWLADRVGVTLASGRRMAVRAVAGAPGAGDAGGAATGDRPPGAAPALRLVPGGKPAADAPPAGGGGGKGGGGAAPGADDGSDGGGEDDDFPDDFFVDEIGVWFIAKDKKDGSPKRPFRVCAPLHVTARTRADDANGWGFLLEFKDHDSNPKTWAMPSAMLSGEGSEWAGRLRDMGLQIAPGTGARNLLAQYIDTRRTHHRVTCTPRVGWHGPVYVLPSSCIASAAVAAEGRRYVFQSESGMEDTFRRHGALEDWQRTVSALAVGNSRIAFALCCAFAGPAVRPAGIESGGFHLRGDSSVGKTTALKVAASVWGRPSFMQRWRTTDNALEAIAAQHSDCVLILDEFGQLDPRVAGEVAYMLANEQEKARATRGAMLRARRTWRLIFLSSGEVGLADHMAEGGKRTRPGMEVRMLDVPLDAGANMGGVELLHGHDGPAALADAIVGAAAQFYGTAGRAWLEWCCENHADLAAQLQALIERYRDQLVPEAAAEQVRRAGTRFALVAAAGELATRAGVTGWPDGEALRAVRQCFNAWLGARGHLDNGEDAAMLRQVRQFLELNAEGRLTWWHRAMDDHAPKTLNRAGFRRKLNALGRPITSEPFPRQATDEEGTEVDYIILREVFEREVCRGFDPRAVAKLLKRRGHLIGEKASGEMRLLDRQVLPGMGNVKAPCYHIAASIFTDEM